MKKEDSYYTEIAGFLSDEMQPEQKERYVQKMKKNKELLNDVELMKKTWNKFGNTPVETYNNTSEAWDSLHARLEEDGLLQNDEPTARKVMFNYYRRIAAVILLILAVGVPAVLYTLQEFSPTNAMIKHECREGTMTVDLPDGSRVFLNEGSKLNYSPSFDENREVELKGEGYFDVMSDPQRPFHVNTGKVVVTVLGTSFNVRESDQEDIEVFVESGKVRVAMQETQEELILSPGQFAKANQSLTTAEQTNPNYLSWKTREFKFIDEPLSEILSVLETSYHVDVKSDKVPLNDLHLTTTYNNQTFDAILSTICTAFDMDYSKEGKVYILQRN